MPLLRDRYGLPLTTTSETAAEWYRQGLDCSLAANAGAVSHLEAAVAADESLALAHAALAGQYATRGDKVRRDEALERAARFAPRATFRERQHVEIITRIQRGDKSAYELLRDHLRAFPTDAYILAQVTGAYGILAFSGRRDFDRERLGLLEPLAAHYGEDWWFLGMHAFSLAELFRHCEAREKAERSLALRYHNGHAAHGYAHVLYESGCPDEGARFLAAFAPGYDDRSPIAGHLFWHQALFEAQRGDGEAALAIYRTRLRPAVATSPDYGKGIDAVSALWRLGLLGVDVPRDCWEELSEARQLYAAPAPDPFLDVHGALLRAAVEPGSAEGWREELRGKYQRADHPLTGLVADLAEGFAAFATGAYGRSAALLVAVMEDLPRLGGSHAQRGLVAETLREAQRRSGHA
jgi:hypothetical protein